MLSATYWAQLNMIVAYLFWFGGLLLHLVLMFSFTKDFVLNHKFTIKNVYASWFVPYVGLAVAGVAAPAVKMHTIGEISFWFGLITFIIILPIVLKRVLIVKEIPDAFRPSMGIIAAPAGLCLTAYMSSFINKNSTMVVILLVVSQILYWIMVFKIPVIIKPKFFPSFSGFTFPFINTCLSLTLVTMYLSEMSIHIALLDYLVIIETIIAMIITLYVFLRYFSFLVNKFINIEDKKKQINS